MSGSVAHVGGRWGTDPVDVAHDLRAVEGGGRWAVALPYAGTPVCIRFADWSDEPPDEIPAWRGPAADAWATSMSEAAYCAAVDVTRERIARGDLYQANICRILNAPLDQEASLLALHARLLGANPAPFAALIDVPEAGVGIVSASPERFLRRRGDVLMSSPIKGTGQTADDLQDKDVAENVMIVDLVRNDLSKVCEPGSVEVPNLLRTEAHPGLVHLVSDVTGRLMPGTPWTAIIDATFPLGSVTGAPKSSALRLIHELEPASRELYCGAIGWIDGDTGDGELAVAIRTFWRRAGMLHFGTGAGITWGSDPGAEWQETVLKASRLITLASGASR